MRVVETCKLPKSIEVICLANIKIAEQVIKEEKESNQFHLYQPSVKQNLATGTLKFWKRVLREVE